MTLLQPEFCPHDGGEIVMHGNSGPLCGNCHAPMAFVARRLVVDQVMLHDRIETLAYAEVTALRSPMSRQERACRKATRDAFRLVLDLMDEMRDE